MGWLFHKADSTAEIARRTANTAQQGVDVLRQQLCDHVEAANNKFDLFEKHADERHRDIKVAIFEINGNLRALRNSRAKKS